MFLYLSLAVITIVVIKLFQKRNERATFGIYQKPGRWYFLKLSLMLLLLKTRKAIDRWQLQWKKARDSSNAGYGFKSRVSPEDMDKQQPLSNHPKAIDAVYFNAASRDGHQLVVGTAHRPHGVVNGFMCLRVPDIGLLMTPKLPDTITFRTEEEGTHYGAEGIRLKPVKPMKSWDIMYDGKMKLHGDPKKMYDVALYVKFTSSLPYFDFDTDMEELAVAKGMALEPWSQEYFSIVRDFHQTHYEQHGSFEGHVVINGNKYPLCLDGARDHSYARKRDWSNFHRYVIHFITLENGARMTITVVCVPMVFSRMAMGYMYKPDDTLLPIQWCDLKLQYHGENGKPPSDYSFFFQAGGEKYHVQVDIAESFEFFMGWEWEARIVENLAHFTVNGVAGWGAVEWEYRHLGGRPGEVASNDPPFTHQI
ncbi:uncharacterized protein LOC111862314 isoform X2 [Cryptotermes secundus]|nr:uncharacterized protein LOC111862314 isoform X2 [Cryptotermes secundus]